MAQLQAVLCSFSYQMMQEIGQIGLSSLLTLRQIFLYLLSGLETFLIMWRNYQISSNRCGQRMPTFKAPSYTKVLNPKTGVLEPSYTFNIVFNSNESLPSFIANTDTDISLQSLQDAVLENISWWNAFIKEFMNSSSKLFSKPYTLENINKVTRHTLIGTNSNKFPVNVTLMPKNIQIHSGLFTVNWEYSTEYILIEIPDSENKVTSGIPVSKDEDEIEERNIDELPDDKNATEEETLEIDSPTKLYDKQRVKEYRLKAKLALYKAQRQMADYYKKYGDEVSDTDSDLETNDTSDNDSENID